ncbi:MAG: hypothetical protein F4X18_02460 [Acidimicrobiia bacterium]|nr:hypothetical protein [Acidimicrobiia bacterium]
MTSITREASEERLILARWLGTPACPGCGSGRAAPIRTTSGPWRRWRCRDCRKRYAVTTGTAIHATKLPPERWIAAVELESPETALIARTLGVSQVTARRISVLLRPARDRVPAERLRCLLRDRQESVPDRDPWQLDPLPATLRAEVSPLGGLSPGAKATLNALRARPFGATAAKLALLSGLSYSQTLRCLGVLALRGWAERARTTVQVGYELKRVTLWTLSWSDDCIRALAFLRDRPTTPPTDTGDRVPPRFWRFFWSGATADTLRISEHGLHIAEALVGGRDPCARAWALRNLPTRVLEECRTLRGCDTGLRAVLLDAEIARRAAEA